MEKLILVLMVMLPNTGDGVVKDTWEGWNIENTRTSWFFQRSPEIPPVSSEGKFESFMLVVCWITRLSWLRSSHLVRFIARFCGLSMWIYSLTASAAFIHHMKQKPNNVGPFQYQLTDNWWKPEPRSFWRKAFSSASPLSRWSIPLHVGRGRIASSIFASLWTMGKKGYMICNLGKKEIGWGFSIVQASHATHSPEIKLCVSLAHGKTSWYSENK